MPKAYWVVHADVHHPEPYADYVQANAAAFKKFGGRFLVRGGAFTVVEGSSPRQRNVVVEFPSYQAAQDCWHSAEYQDARAHRLNAAEFDVVIVEGYDGPQPAAT